MKAFSQGRKPIFLRVAQELRARVNAGFVDEPQSIGSMAKVWGISRCTMRKAVLVLAGDGLVDCTQGRPIRRKDPNPERTQPHYSPAESRFHEIIKSRILDGTYRWGASIPKVNYFIVSDRVSSTTVAAACSRLAGEGLIFKSGKHWIVGNCRRFPSLSDAGSRRPTVLLVFPLGLQWNAYFTHSFVVPYSLSLAEELQQLGRATSMAFINEGESTELQVPVGAGKIVAFAKSLGDNYCGAHVYFGVQPPAESIDCLRALLKLGEPLVLFDHAGEYENLATGLRTQRKRPFYRCHMDERGAVRLALQSLADAGHTRIGVPFYKGFTWALHRCALIEDVAKEIHPRPEIIIAEQKETFWRYSGGFDLSQYTRQLESGLQRLPERASEGTRGRDSLRAKLLAQTPSLIGLLVQQGVTAILALNDGMAREIYLWTRYVGLSVPRDVSIISFDNSVECRNFPVSTIDFGFSRLGYRAAHVFIGDIPVKADRYGNVPGICTLVDRGSIGKPADSTAIAKTLRTGTGGVPIAAPVLF